MGLAANQARLLTLQSRMHDLELTSMRCTNEKILLTAQSNNIANTYNELLTAANNIDPTLKTSTNTTVYNGTSSTSGTKGTEAGWSFNNMDLDYNTLKKAGYDIGAKGSKATANTTESTWNWYTTGGEGWEMPQTVNDLIQLLGNKGIIDTNAGATGWNSDGTKSTTQTTYKILTGFQPEGESECEYESYQSANRLAKMFAKYSSADTSSYNTRVDFSQSKLESILGPMGKSNSTPDNSKIGNSSYGYYSGGSTSYSYTEDDLVKECKKNPETLRQALIDGTVAIFEGATEKQLSELTNLATYNEGTTGTEGSVVTDSWTQTSTIQSYDYSERDKKRQEAQSYYDRETGKLTIKEKALDIKSKQAETEYSAACTEYESVKSLISKNAERGFSLFG